MNWKTAPHAEIVLPTHPDDWADVDQVALGLNCSKATVYREIKEGRLQHPIKMRGRSLWRWGWVLDYKRRKEEEVRRGPNEKPPEGEPSGGWGSGWGGIA